MKRNLLFVRLTRENFDGCSLDRFRRHQAVSQVWRRVEGQWTLVPLTFEEDWDLVTCREIAGDVAAHMEKDQSAFGCFDGPRLVGFVTVSHNAFGKTARYLELVCFQVSEPYRGCGIGKRLFAMAAEEARRLGGERLYISAHSSQETQAAYKALGCTLAQEINKALAAEEPFDVPLEYVL